MPQWYEAIHTAKRFRLMTKKTDIAGNVYIYLKGVASLAAGDFVGYDGTGTTTRTVAATTGSIGCSISANTATTSFSWFLVSGRFASANIATHSSGSGKALFTTATAGRLTTTPATEATVVGAFSDGNSASNVGPVYINVSASAPGDIST